MLWLELRAGRWLDEQRARRRRARRLRRDKLAIVCAAFGTPPTRRMTGRMLRVLWGGRR